MRDDDLIVIPLHTLHARAAIRPAGYAEDVLSRAKHVGATHYILTRQVQRELVAKYAKNDAPKASLAPLPRTEWPTWAKALAACAVAADTGVGDVVHRLLGAGGEAFKATMKLWGVPCQCDKRQAEWNVKYPLP